MWLEKRFKDYRYRSAVTKITFIRKRSYRKVPGAYVLRLEDFAKIRHSFNFEPTRSIADPKSLWTMQADGGFYEEAFGVDGDLLSFWSDEEFDRGLLAVSFYKAIEEKIAEAVKKDKAFIFLRRLRFFSLALAQTYIGIKFPGRRASDLLCNDISFKRMFDEFWSVSVRELNDAHHQATEVDKISGFALVRSEQRWKSVKDKFNRYLRLTS